MEAAAADEEHERRRDDEFAPAAVNRWSRDIDHAIVSGRATLAADIRRGLYDFGFAVFVIGFLLYPIAWIAPLRASDFPAYYVTAKQIVSGHASDVYILVYRTLLDTSAA